MKTGEPVEIDESIHLPRANSDLDARLEEPGAGASTIMAEPVWTRDG